MGIAKNQYKKLGVNRNSYSFDFNYFLNGMNSSIDESIQSVSNAYSIKNFTVKKGVLSTGLGLRILTFPSDLEDGAETPYEHTYTGQALSVYSFPYYDVLAKKDRDMLFIYTSDHLLYYMKYSSPYRPFFKYSCPEFTSIPDYLYYIMPDGKESGLFCSENEPLTLLNFFVNYKVVENAPSITNLCVHYDRVFAVTRIGRSKVWFSDEMDPTNWNISSTEGGYIGMNDSLGDCKKVLSFNNYVFVFREYGITRITAYASQESFSMQNVYASSNYIYTNTACICGDVICFLATDGLYMFDGVNARKVNAGFEKIYEGINQDKAKGVFYKNSYYLMMNTNLAPINELQNVKNTLLRYDCEDGLYDILTNVELMDIEKMTSSGIERLVSIDIQSHEGEEGFETRLSQINYFGDVYGKSTEKEWISPYTDLGKPDYTKNIYAIALQTTYDCDVEIITDKMSQIVHFKGSDKAQRKPVFVSGVMIKIKISTQENEAMISHPILYYRLGKANA